MTLVAGVDSSTQSCKVLVVDADTGAVIRAGSAAHPPGTEVTPQAWWSALEQAREAAGGFDDVAAVSVAAQQHGMVCLDQDAVIVRDALLWNDLRSTGATAALLAEMSGGAAGWAQAVGSVPVPSFTVTKLRWLAEHEPERLRRTAALCLPHDWLTWKLRGSSDIAELTTDRSDASGTGYWSPSTGQYRDELLQLACGRVPQLPAVLGPVDPAGSVGGDGPLLGCGAGDNAAAALGVDLHPGDVLISLGTSGTACAVHDSPTADPTGAVAGFADATGRFLPLVCTLNATRVFDVIARTLRVDREQLADLALSAPSGAGGVVVVPYWEGERTPDRPTATGAIHGLQLHNTTPANLARAAFEGVLCGIADGIDAIRAQGLAVRQVSLVGGGARSRAVREIAASVCGLPVTVLADPEAVAKGAARQAAWTLSRRTGPPDWPVATRSIHQAPADVELRERYARARDLTLSSP